MRIFSALAPSSILVATALAQAIFEEPSDFNVTQALLDKGINVTAIPELAGLAQRSSTSRCSIACSSLRLLFGTSKLADQQSAAYDAVTNSYWSVQQSSVDPYCIFKPSNSADVSVAVLLARLTQCSFAIKSGGHAAFAGASNIAGGITIGLQNINQVVLSSDKMTAEIGPGNTWYDAYSQLESQNLTVIGGRVAAIGVGGLTLGGGLSFFSNTYGWACDNVASFEVVTASGKIITSSPTLFPDLYWALRGGGNNFGVVTKFTLNTISQGKMWGGGRLHIETEFPAVMQAFYNLGLNSAQDTNAAQILSFGYAQSTKFASVQLEYAQPVANAPIFAEYMAIPTISDTTKIRSLSDLTVELNASNPNGLRETYWSATFKLDKDLINFIQTVFFDEVTAIIDAANILPVVTLQVITTPQLSHMSQKGGNPLGLSTESGPLILLNPNAMWSDISDDTRILKANSNIVKRTVAEAKRRGLYVDYIYMNYASQFQDVITSYGTTNKAKLKRIAKIYDPTAVFQNIQPGYFKLDGAPDPSMI